jgi:hypothetical protein
MRSVHGSMVAIAYLNLDVLEPLPMGRPSCTLCTGLRHAMAM